MELPEKWPGPIIHVQSLAASGVTTIPRKYVKPPTERPKSDFGYTTPSINVPIVDMKGLRDAAVACPDTRRSISDACKEWGFLHVVNHGVSPDLMRRMREVWREVFHLPMEQKLRCSNSPMNREGYGTRNGAANDASHDWGDYFYLRILPQYLRKHDRWPAIPNSSRETVEEYTMEAKKLSMELMKVLSLGLGLEMEYIEKALGGEDGQTYMGVSFYPKCPQPELTLGASPHCDGSGLTILLADDRVKGLQVRKGEAWVPIQLVPNALVVNVGDLIQVLSNGIYKSVEHRVLANSEEERLSIALFFNPRGNIPIAPAKELVTQDFPPLYRPITHDDCSLYRVMKGTVEKSQAESFMKAN